MNRFRSLLPFSPILAAGVVILDEWLKQVALQQFPDETELRNPGILEFAIHKNWGIAFDIPFKLTFIVIVTAAIGLFLAHVVWKNYKTNPPVAISALLIIIGASGNLFDRLVYGFTVDYLILFGRSAINLSDLVIVIGVIALLFTSRRLKSAESSEHIH